ncbi:MAG: hypothetical protein QXM27_02455 [Candidatus Pacearchaeota archaeon]
MRKILSFLILFFILVLSISFASAIINETKQVDNAYNWLENNITKSGWPETVLDHEAALLALSYHDGLRNNGIASLKRKGYPTGNPYCWGEKKVNNENECKIKETAIASLIYEKFKLDYSKINEWLLNSSDLFRDIYWFIEIDVERNYNASCSAEYDGKIINFTINRNKTISILPPSSKECLNVYNNYWISIDKTCYDKSFKIVCNVEENKPYKISFLYKEDIKSNKWYSSNFIYSLNSGEYFDITIKDISICLKDKTSKSCDYEGTVIAAYVLKIEGYEEYSTLMPYLILNKDKFSNVNSYAFLYLITGNEEFGNIILRNQTSQGFWKISGFGQFYDTAINSYALKENYNINFNETKTKNYLLTQQNPAGYWKCGEIGCKIIRDTSLILYVFWPRAISGGGGGGGTIPTNQCEEKRGSCKLICDINEIEYTILNYVCGNNKCCINPIYLNCADFGGEICEIDEDCVNGEFVTSSDSERCCYGGDCLKAEKSCEDQSGYICDNENKFCFGEELPANDTKGNEVCCDEPCKSCTDGGGKICGSDEICKGDLKGEVCCIGECVKKECEGEICDKPGWKCEGNLINTIEGECCLGDCIKSCEEEGGEICKQGYVCKGEKINASDIKKGEVCCIGECKKKGGGAWWLIILIILIIIIAAIIYFGYRKGIFKIKPKEKPEKPEIFKVETPKIKPTPIPAMPRPLPKPITIKPMPPTKIELPKEKIETKKEEKKKSKTEEELEKTLKKIRELTK